jgi:glycosyltransferase involved in cell wall biosynthesis
MSTSAAVLDFEITRKFPDATALGDVDSALALFRLHGRPLGWGAAPVSGGRADVSALLRQLLEQHAWSCALVLTERALQHGAPPRTLDLTAVLQSMPQEPSSGPLVTVAVCNSTPASRLEPCLESLQRLEYAPLDLVVVDASDDRKRVERLVRERFPLVRYSAASGGGAAPRHAVEECRGNILAITDGDAIVDPRWVSRLAQIFLSDPEVMTVSGLALPRSIQKPIRPSLPAGAPFCREWSRVQLEAEALDASMHAVLERASANVALWCPHSSSATAYTHVFEPSAIVRTECTTLMPSTRRRMTMRETERTIDLANGFGAIDDATSFDAVAVHVNWSGRSLGTAHIPHHGAVVSPLWVSDAIARQLTAEVLDARLGVGEHVCRALLTADLARFVLSRTPLEPRERTNATSRRTASAA